MKEYLHACVSMLRVISTYLHLSTYPWCFTVAVRTAKAARYSYLPIGLFNSTAASISAIKDYEAGQRNTLLFSGIF